MEPREINLNVFGLESGVDKAFEIIKEKVVSTDENIVVLVAGGSASGKTSRVAKKFRDEFKLLSTLVSADNYYYGRAYMEAEAAKGNILNWDQPEAVNLKLLLEHIRMLKRGENIPYLKYSFENGKVETINSRTHKARRVIIVEGLFVLHSSIATVGDLNIFVDIGVHGRMIRRLMRDVKRTTDKRNEIIKYFTQVVEPMHEEYIEVTKENAHLVISNEYNPDIESKNTDRVQSQLKFKMDLDDDYLVGIGAQRMGAIDQWDYYFNPTGKDLLETDEIVRIRREADRFVFTYKGPRDPKSKTLIRHFQEVEIDESTAKSFMNIYGELIVVIVKAPRIFYVFEGVVFSIDKVAKGGKELGDFLEVRGHENHIKLLLKRLGMKIEDGIRLSYLEM